MAKKRLIDEMKKPDSVVIICLHCGHGITNEEFIPAVCPKCGREPNPPLEFLAELADEGKLKDYLDGKYLA